MALALHLVKSMYNHLKKQKNKISLALTTISLVLVGALVQAKAPPVAVYAASDIEINQALTCAPVKIRSSLEIQKYFSDKIKNLPFGDYEVSGLHLKNESSHFAKLFKKIIEPIDASLQNPYAGQLRHLNLQCQNVKCMLSKIFGDDDSLRVLYLLDKYNINISHLVLKNTIKPKTNQIDIIFDVLDLLPSTLERFPRTVHLIFGNDFLLRSTDVVNSNINRAATTYDYGFVLFNFWASLSDAKKRFILLHEFAHYWAMDMKIGSAQEPVDQSAEWLRITGWQMIPTVPDPTWQNIYIESEDKYHIWPSDRAQAGANEDFAESVASYRLSPEKLKTNNLKRYRYVQKTVFKGAEFIEKNKCAKPISVR